MVINTQGSARLHSPLARPRTDRVRPGLAPALTRLLDEFDERLDTLPLPELTDWLARAPVGVGSVAPFVRFDERRYTRNPA